VSLEWPAATGIRQLPFRRLFTPIRRIVPDGAQIVTAYTDGQVTLRSNRAKVGYHEASDLSGYQGVEAGDFVVHGLDIMRGSVGVSDAAGAMSSVCTVCLPRPLINKWFAAYVIRAQAASGYPKALARGVREGGADFRRWDTLAELPIPVPHLEQQQEVVEFLDAQTAKIDALIGKQEQLIETLAERRQAVISHVVTKGVDPSAPLRPSGVSWIGDIVASWQVVPTRRALVLRRSLVGSRWSQTQLLSLTKQGVSRRDIDGGDGKYPASFESYQRVEAGDLVFCLFDVDETPRTVGRVLEPGMLTGAYTRFAVSDEFDCRYLEWYFISVDDGKRFRPLYTGLRKVIQKSRFLSAGLPKPPLAEQKGIAAYLDRETAQIDALSAKAREMIGVLKERRQALISAAVTGKIDVRGLV